MNKKVFTLLLLAVFILAQFGTASAAPSAVTTQGAGTFSITALPTFHSNSAFNFTWLPFQGAETSQLDDNDINELKEQLLNATIVELYDGQLGQALSQALADDEVQLLRDALLAEGFRPGVNDATAYQATWEADGDSHYAVTVVIPFRGESDYVAIYYGVTSGMEKAGAVSVSGIENYACAITGDCCTETTGEVQFRYYYVEQSVVKVKEVVGNPCTWNCVSSCVQYYGISLIAAAGCISACISCFASLWPSCIVCSVCSGVIVGCAAACCLE
jgi:hypothetical protein